MGRMSKETFVLRALAYNEGVTAAANHEPRATNPHRPDGTDEAPVKWEQWNAGWDDQTNY